MIDPVTISNGTSMLTGEVLETPINSAQFSAACRAAWPDLKPGENVIVIPESDMDAIIESTRGRPILAHRNFYRITVGSPEQFAQIERLETPARRTLWQRLREIFWGEW